ncbi:hypothetical protein [Paenibacillus polymyxa]|uniref:hypothetical protein n=1 Tax=Paenibacillus polymyxa TaxID=1406 RepID=UPI002379FAA7|nr:hypothetical protein [Paenibacillus polymyxa]WDM21830.1 hypothetical protein J4I02_23450 [Paenibacillus polymyxa]
MNFIKQITILLLIMLIALLLDGCSEKSTNEKQQAVEPIKPSTQVIGPKSVTEPESAAQEQDRNSNIVNPINKRNENYATDSNTLDQFIKKIQPQNEQLQKIIKEDLDHDGKPEYVLAFGLEKEEIYNIFVVREDDCYHIIDKLEDPVIVVHLNTDVKIMKLDQTDQKFIVVYSIGDGGAYSEGFSIYTLENNHIKSINSDFPNATGQGIRTLKDTDHDGVFESVDYYEFSDTQEHTIVVYQKYDGTGPEKKEILYTNKSKKFVYPSDPKAVILNYLEVDYLMKRFDLPFPEMDQLTDPAARQTYDFEDAIDLSGLAYLSYPVLELSINEVSSDDNRKIFLVKDDSLEERAKKEILFTLEKKSGKWKIMSIEMNDKS